MNRTDSLEDFRLELGLEPDGDNVEVASSGVVSVVSKPVEHNRLVDMESLSSVKEYWEFVEQFESKSELEAFLSTYTHKMTATHGCQPCICSASHSQIHSSHKQLYGYLRCSSTICCAAPEDRCSFRFKVTKP